MAVFFVFRVASRFMRRRFFQISPILRNRLQPKQCDVKGRCVKKNLRQPHRPCRKSIFRRNVWKNDRGVPMVLVVTIWRTAASGQACSGEAQRAESAARLRVGHTQGEGDWGTLDYLPR